MLIEEFYHLKHHLLSYKYMIIINKEKQHNTNNGKLTIYKIMR